MTFKINEVDRITPQSNLIHSTFPDLVNNFVYYHQKVSTGSNKFWDNQPPKYLNYKSIGEVKDDIIKNPEKYIKDGPITVRCNASLFYTCDSNIPNNEKLMGYDRLYLYPEIMTKGTQYMLSQNGFSSKSDVLHGTVRWIYDKNNKINGFVIVKDRGNLRTHIGIASVAGNDPELLITLDFHENNPNISVDELIAIESETFTEDATDRRGFNADTKFRSGYLANRKSFVVQGEFLDKELEVDFADVINTKRRKQGKKVHKYSLSSLAKLDFAKDGKQAGYLTKYKPENIKAAVGCLKKILDKRKENTQISVSAVHTFAKTFYYLTSSPKALGINKTSGTNIATRKELAESLEYIYCQPTRRGNFIYDLKDLIKSNSEKDTSWLAFKSYMEILLKDLRELNDRTNDYRSNHPCIQAYINDIGEKYNQAEAAKIINR